MIERLAANNFSGFPSLNLTFSKGINVIVGENGTGKTQILKLLYAVHQALREPVKGKKAKLETDVRLTDMLDNIFRPDDHEVGHLVRWKASSSQVIVEMTETSLIFGLTKAGELSTLLRTGETESTATFLPSRDVLTLAYGGFPAIWERFGGPLDQTYKDACIALEGPVEKSEALGPMKPVVQQIEKDTGLRVRRVKGRFFVEQSGQRIDVQLAAEGWRKLGAVTRLIANGTIAPGGILFWDEPEANLNPVLLRSVSSLLKALAQRGVQIFVASHDYLLTQTLSLESEYPASDSPQMKFFGLSRKKSGASIEVQQGSTIADLTDNPILREHARQYDLEMEAVSRELKPPPAKSKRSPAAKGEATGRLRPKRK